ncbi:unnamed protein product [Chironomus riparius]|uniref:Uncharacterized protein n=1 Tax=Chironomus riparius TaxID=315576 RepID=A0A9N9WMS7_9DIPT|nr:unnamed protein product [Chironomus riparius]
MEIDRENKEIENLSGKVNELRVKLREEHSKSQHLHRSIAFDHNRFIESEIFTESDVTGICSRIKRRKHATEEDLIKLATSFYQNEANISAFMKITGAINVIVKEFIGHSDRQLLTAQALCNLSLSDACCSKIATFAGAYLMIYLRNLTQTSLIRVCIWTLQNLVSSNNHKALDILMSQELLQNTLYLTNTGDVELKHEAIQLLDLIVERKWTSLGIDEKDQVIKSIVSYVNSHPLDYNALQCLYRTGLYIEGESLTNLVNLMSGNVINLPFSHDNEKSFYFSVKILSNLFKLDPHHLPLFLEMLLKNNIKLSNIINEALKVPKLFNITNDLIHFAGLILTSEQPVALSYLAHDDLVNNLQIPKMFAF